MTKTIKGFIKTFNKHELGKEYSKTNSYLADGILFELKDVYNAGTNDSVIYPYIYEVEAKIEDILQKAKLGCQIISKLQKLLLFVKFHI